MPETVFSPETDRAAIAAAEAHIRLTLRRLATLAAPGAAPARLERKQAAVMAYLHHVGSTPRGRLAGLLWPAATASTARGNLRQCLARVRRIAPGVLSEDADAVALGPSVAVAAPDENRAELLQGYDYADCDDFARWLQTRVDDERSARQATLTSALRTATQRGDLVDAQVRADALLALDRESEDAYRALMEVAYLRGDYAAAVRIWDRCREMLRQIYGVSPSAATQALGAAILAAAPAPPTPPPPATLPARAGRTTVGRAASRLDTRRRDDGGGTGAASAPAATATLVTAASARRTGPGNLAITLPALYGRETELAALAPMLQRHRLVTLIGIGGIGKTSLALAAAHAEQGRRADGVWWVDMAPLREPASLPGAISQVLGLGHCATAVGDLVRALRASAMLIVLDNAEHLWEGVADLAAALLSGTEHLRLLVTSRQALRIAPEQRFALSGLPTPTATEVADLRQFGALALFEARAATLDPHFRLTTGNAPAIAEICARLDGLPLAIELAAARVPVLGVEELRSRLQQSLRVLGGRATLGTPRQQTLRATFDWTHALLTVAEQLLLRRLAVFEAGFTLALAEQVAGDASASDGPESPGGDAWSLLDDLSGLIDKSLLAATDTDPPRYRMLEVTRAYALEKLSAAGELDLLSERHARAIWRLFAGTEAALNEATRGAISRGAFLRRLAPELANLRAARAWSRKSADHPLLSVGLAATSTEALRILGLSNEALQALLDLRDVVDERRHAPTAELFWTGICFLGTHGHLPGPELLEAIDRAERLYRRVGSRRRIHVGLYQKGSALLHLGAGDAAQLAVREMESLEGADWPARAVAQRLGLQGATEHLLGGFDAAASSFGSAAALLADDPDEHDVVLHLRSNRCMPLIGAERHDEALAVADDVLRAAPSPVVRNIAQRAAFMALTFLGRLDEAGALARRAMPGWRVDDMMARMLGVFAWFAYLQGRTADALRIDGAAESQVLRKGLSNSPIFLRARMNLERAIANHPLAATDVARWRQEGEQLDGDDLVAACLGERVLFGRA